MRGVLQGAERYLSFIKLKPGGFRITLFIKLFYVYFFILVAPPPGGGKDRKNEKIKPPPERHLQVTNIPCLHTWILRRWFFS